MNWKNIRVYNNSQNNAFEELVCQLARQEKTSGYKRFVRNGTPDGGVECFWELEDGRKIAWQAKYVFDIDGVIAEADRSYNNALKSHATMCKFVIAIPFDLLFLRCISTLYSIPSLSRILLICASSLSNLIISLSLLPL